MRQIKQILVVCIAVDSVHQCVLDDKRFMYDLCDRGQTIGCARGVRDDVMCRRIVHMLVNAEHYGYVLTLCRGRDDYLLNASSNMLRRVRRVGKVSGRFNNYLCTDR